MLDSIFELVSGVWESLQTYIEKFGLDLLWAKLPGYLIPLVLLFSAALIFSTVQMCRKKAAFINGLREMLLNSAGVWFGAAVFVIFCLLFPKAYWGNREWYLVALVVLIGFLVALGACCGVLDTFITGIRHYGFLTGTSLAFVELGTSFTLFSLIVFWGSKMFFVSLLSLGLLVFARFWPGKN